MMAQKTPMARSAHSFHEVCAYTTYPMKSPVAKPNAARANLTSFAPRMRRKRPSTPSTLAEMMEMGSQLKEEFPLVPSLGSFGLFLFSGQQECPWCGLEGVERGDGFFLRTNQQGRGPRGRRGRSDGGRACLCVVCSVWCWFVLFSFFFLFFCFVFWCGKFQPTEKEGDGLEVSGGSSR